MQWSASKTKNDEDYNVQNKCETMHALSNAWIRVAVVLLNVRIHVCVGRDENLAHVHVAFTRRQMQRGTSTDKKSNITYILIHVYAYIYVCIYMLEFKSNHISRGCKWAYMAGCHTDRLVHLWLRWTQQETGTRLRGRFEKTNAVGSLNCKNKTSIICSKKASKLTKDKNQNAENK
jgi:hypothetical protein